ncbi:response regulator [Knoellia sinensis]|uniref:response regulator n=1 Tax=Knoellia sinensis TaxID=136100 RepID=UPI000AE7677A|nr:response regulator transcription factor [Knoellia sinensis]
MIRVGVVEDHPLFRDGLRNLLAAEGLQVVAESSDVSGIDSIVSAAPDVVVVDLGLPDGTGLDVVRRLRKELSTTRLLVLTMSADGATASRSLAAGAHGHLVKDADPAEVVAAIRSVSAGSVVVGASVADRLHGISDTAAFTPAAEAFPSLTLRERQVLGLVADGWPNSRIATELGLSDKTVSNYVSSILSTLHAPNRAALSGLVREATGR